MVMWSPFSKCARSKTVHEGGSLAGPQPSSLRGRNWPSRMRSSTRGRSGRGASGPFPALGPRASPFSPDAGSAENHRDADGQGRTAGTVPRMAERRPGTDGPHLLSDMCTAEAMTRELERGGATAGPEGKGGRGCGLQLSRGARESRGKRRRRWRLRREDTGLSEADGVEYCMYPLPPCARCGDGGRDLLCGPSNLGIERLTGYSRADPSGHPSSRRYPSCPATRWRRVACDVHKYHVGQ